MQVYDIKGECPQIIKDIFYDELEYIANSNLQLKENYSITRLKLDSMISFDVLIDNEMDLVCFGGLQKINDEIARVSSRHYVSQKYIKTWKQDRFRPNWQYLVPKQIKRAYELGYKGLFWSAHIYKKKFLFDLTCRNAEKYTDVMFTPLPGLYNVFNTAQRVCQIGDYDLGFANENIFMNDDYFYQHKDELYTIIKDYPKANEGWTNDNPWKGEWIDYDTGIIHTVNLNEILPDHHIIKHLYNYFDEIYKVMICNVLKGPVPEHMDQSEHAQKDHMHIKIKIDGDWSKFYVRDQKYNWKTYFPNDMNIAIFDNEKNMHAVDDGQMLLIVPYGKLKREIYERVDTESR
jgi:hypothetical protein